MSRGEGSAAMPRVLFWSELFWPHLGGVEVLGLELVCAMKKRGYDFAVVTSHGPVEAPDRGDRQGRVPYTDRCRRARCSLPAGGLDQG